jgi:rsbT co-antagonist protein RsbR
MATKSGALSHLQSLLKKNEKEVLAEWVSLQLAATSSRSDLIKESELREQSRQFLAAFAAALGNGNMNPLSPEWEPVRAFLAGISRSRALQGFTPAETALFVFSLKPPVFNQLRADLKGEELVESISGMTDLIDRLGLHTTELYQQSREEVIVRQQKELLELSTPVVQLWDDILALPLVGTLDSARTQVVMETLLQKVVETGAEIAIIDITGVPTVDTLVAQHLIKTVAATRLMGADCIISGIRPQIAQTIVHLGVNLGEVITKATLADAFAIALKRTGNKVVRDAPVAAEQD